MNRVLWSGDLQVGKHTQRYRVVEKDAKLDGTTVVTRGSLHVECRSTDAMGESSWRDIAEGSPAWLRALDACVFHHTTRFGSELLSGWEQCPNCFACVPLDAKECPGCMAIIGAPK
jgi:hypothetical protein